MATASRSGCAARAWAGEVPALRCACLWHRQPGVKFFVCVEWCLTMHRTMQYAEHLQHATAIAHCCSATQMPGFTEVWERHVGSRYRARAFGISGALSLPKTARFTATTMNHPTSSAIQGVALPCMSCR